MPSKSKPVVVLPEYRTRIKSGIQSAIESAATLLEFAGDAGGLDGCAAGGIGEILRLCADQVDRFLFTQDDIRRCGGDPTILWAKLEKR